MADLSWDKIVGDKTLDDGGYVGDLLAVARAHLDEAFTKGEVTAGELGEVYTTMIASAFQQGIAFDQADATFKLNKVPSVLK